MSLPAFTLAFSPAAQCVSLIKTFTSADPFTLSVVHVQVSSLIHVILIPLSHESSPPSPRIDRWLPNPTSTRAMTVVRAPDERFDGTVFFFGE